MSGNSRALVIDDEAAILRFLKPALEANNYEMSSAGTVAEGIKRIAPEVPDIVLLDLGLPDGDGKDIIRRAPEWSDCPRVIAPFGKGGSSDSRGVRVYQSYSRWCSMAPGHTIH